MARIERRSKAAASSTHDIPERLREAAVFIDNIAESGMIGEIFRRCLIRREGGFSGGDIVVFLIAYFCSGTGAGLKSFYLDNKRWWPHLAALADRARLPTPASVARAFANVNAASLKSFQRWLLTESLDYGALLSHPSAQYRDAKGRFWQVFHFDPTTRVLR